LVTTDKVEKSQSTKRPKVKDEIRLNKYISNSGACSRRDADIYITSGTVKVNGIAVTEMGYMVKPGDVVNFDGATLRKKGLHLLNKPKNHHGRFRNVLELVKGSTTAKKLVDKNTTGLLLFTNDTDKIRTTKSSKIYH
jgi:23S rRNA pseudouridine2605 synthase